MQLLQRSAAVGAAGPVTDVVDVHTPAAAWGVAAQANGEGEGDQEASKGGGGPGGEHGCSL